MKRENHTYIYLGILCLVYASTLIYNYGFGDDYYFSQNENLTPLHNPYVEHGRPIAGLIIVPLLSLLNTTPKLVILRAISLLLSLSFFSLLTKTLKSHLPPTWALGLALMIVTSPGWLVYVGWSICFLYPLAALIAYISGQWILKSINEPHPLKSQSGRIFLGMLGVIASLSIYQNCAFFFLLPAAIQLFANKEGSRLQLIKIFFIYGLSCIAYYLFIEYGIHRMIELGRQTERFSITDHILPNIQYVSIEALKAIAYSWGRLSRSPLEMYIYTAVGSLSLAYFVYANIKKHKCNTLLSLSLYLCLLGGSLIPNFAAKATNAHFRTFTPLYAIVYAFIIFQLYHLYNHKNKTTYALYVFWLLAGIHLLSACYYLNIGMVLPNAKVHREICHYLREKSPKKPKGMIYIRPPQRNIQTEHLKEINEFGKQHNLYGWAFMFYHKALLKELYPEDTTNTVYVPV